MPTLPPGAAPAMHDAFPYVPARWVQTAPFAITTGHAYGPSSGPGRRFVSLSRYAGGPENVERYGLEVSGRDGTRPMTMLGPDGCLYEAAPGYKLHAPPTFDGPGAFAATVEMGDAYAAGYVPPVVHRDTVRYELHDYGAESTTRYSTRTLWNGEPGTPGAQVFDTWGEASAAADKNNRALRARATRAAKRAKVAP